MTSVLLVASATSLVAKSFKRGLGHQHREDRVADDEAAGRLVAELGVEGVAELAPERLGGVDVLDRQVDEDHGGHLGSSSRGCAFER